MLAGSETLPLLDQIDLLLRDAQPFRDWLESQEPSAVVGYAHSEPCCPLARFLSEQVGAEVEVGILRAYVGGGHIPLPLWAKCFVALLEGNAAADMPSPPVTAAEAGWHLWVALGG